ncbi:hypothetical protein C0995_008381, partial [Termitomyces sp. Mi166
FTEKELAMLFLPSSEYFKKDTGLLKGAKTSGRRKAELVLAAPNGMGVKMQEECPPVEVLELAKHVKIVKAAKTFLKCQGKPSGFYLIEGLKTKERSKVIAAEKTGAKHTFKSESVDSDSNEDNKEKRVHLIKKSKLEHVKFWIALSVGEIG